MIEELKIISEILGSATVYTFWGYVSFLLFTLMGKVVPWAAGVLIADKFLKLFKVEVVKEIKSEDKTKRTK